MVYGWALVIIVTIASILFVFTSGSYSKNTCQSISKSFFCKGVYTDGYTVIMKLQNAFGRKMTINPFEDICFDGKCGYASIVYKGKVYGDEEVTILPGEEFTINGYGMAAANQVSITYNETENNYSKTDTVNLETDTKEKPELPTGITDCYGLQNIKDNNLAGNFILMSDIDCTGFAFTSIGTLSSPFKGKLYGQGHKIKNLLINSGNNNVGLFGYLMASNIENLTLQDSSITGVSNVGGITGNMYGSAISNVNAINNTITAGSNYAGGIAGYSQNSTINNVNIINGKITGYHYAGGIIGDLLESSISGSDASAQIVCTSLCGKCVGANNGAIYSSNCQ